MADHALQPARRLGGRPRGVRTSRSRDL